ncbi:MAG: NnrU family protein [Rhodospirillales bacterium]
MTALSLVNDYWASALAFAAFGLLHSVGAQEPLKEALARWTGASFVDHFWRVVYCGLSFWALYYGVASLHWARNTAYDVWLVTYPDWLWQAVVVLHLGSIALIYVAFLQSDYLEFLGFKQAWRGISAMVGKSPDPPEIELFGTHRLIVTGVYAWVRHPMMVGGYVFLLTSGPSLNNIVYTAMYTAYMVIGGHYEERRMLRIFGDDYRRYQRQVGAFIPHFRRKSWA